MGTAVRHSKYRLTTYSICIFEILNTVRVSSRVYREVYREVYKNITKLI